jgi:hypothetical protein
MPPDRPEDRKLDAESVLVRPIGGQVYLIQEGDEYVPLDDEPAPDRSPSSGLINRH